MALLVLPLVTSVVFSPGASRPSLQARIAATRAPAAEMGLFGRFREKRKVQAAPMIAAGAALPKVDVEVFGDGEAIEALPLTEALGNGTTLLVGMPGAFTPTCSQKHLPSLVSSAPTLTKLGVSKICVVTTNDRYVNEAWREATQVNSPGIEALTMLSDGDGDAVKALGLADDMGFGIGVRSKRFAILASDGLVQHVAVDEGMDTLEMASVDSVIRELTPESEREVEAFDFSKLDGNAKAVVFGVAVLLLGMLSKVQGGGDAATTTAALGATAGVGAAKIVTTKATVAKSAAVVTSNGKGPVLGKAASGYQKILSP